MNKLRLIHAVDAIERIAATLSALNDCAVSPDEIRIPAHEACALALVAAEAVIAHDDDNPDLGPYYAPGTGPYLHAYTHDAEGQLRPYVPA